MNDAPKRPRLPVLLVNTPTLPPIGADTWIHVEVVRALDRERFDVHVACNEGPADAPAPMFVGVSAIPDTHVIPVDFGSERTASTVLGRVREAVGELRAVGSFVRLARYVRRHHIPIIHTVSRTRDALACVLLARATRTTCIIHMQLGFADWMSRPLRWSLRHADGLVSISDYVTSTLVANGIPTERIHKAYNAVVFEDWNPVHDKTALRAELGLPTDGPMVVSVSRLFPAKGTAELLQATAIVRATIPDVKVVVVGRDIVGGAYTRELDKIVEREGLAENVIFTGQRSDVPRYMAAADVFSMPSTCEPFGIVFAEAQAMELPVVALNDGGTPEVVDDGRAGLLSDHGDIQAIADNLLTLLGDPERRQEMGRYGRQQVKDRFTVQHLGDAMGKIYEQVAG